VEIAASAKERAIRRARFNFVFSVGRIPLNVFSSSIIFEGQDDFFYKSVTVESIYCRDSVDV
jgi:hypothetical protein